MEQERVKMRKLESVGVLAGGIAHDFNNLLSAILGNIELAASGVKEDSKISSLLADAQKATERATKLTYQLLTFSKGGEPIKEKPLCPIWSVSQQILFCMAPWCPVSFPLLTICG